ncbi:hypothetical protein BC826DRAFT_1005795 [Russula brevipes]|nr:hypothetical protein BC826DRAFT_1005795 [Russula brevipes]
MWETRARRVVASQQMTQWSPRNTELRLGAGWHLSKQNKKDKYVMRRFLAYHMTAPREPTPPFPKPGFTASKRSPTSPLSQFLCPLQPDMVGRGGKGTGRGFESPGPPVASRGGIRSLRKRPRRVAPLVAPRLVATRSSRESPKSCIYVYVNCPPFSTLRIVSIEQRNHKKKKTRAT